MGAHEDDAQHHAPQVARLEGGEARDDHEERGEDEGPWQHAQAAHLTGAAPMLDESR
jgi:hypothetical protein